MALPQQVQAALDAADATLAQANAPSVEPGGVAEATPLAPPAPEPQASPPEAAPAPATPKEEPWEHKYRVLQGKYSSEIPVLHQQVRTLESNLKAAVERLDQASKAPERPPEPKQAVNPKDVEEFGADLTEMVSRVAAASLAQATKEFEAKTKAMEAKIASMTEQLTGTSEAVAATSEQAFFDRLAKQVPDWEQTNADQGFLTWLAEADPVYGVPRQEALRMAQQRLDVNRAAAVFDAYTGPRKVVAKPKASLEQQVSPKGAATTAPAPNAPQFVTQAQITQFYNEVRQGKYRGNDAEATRIEQVINAALAEGRVR